MLLIFDEIFTGFGRTGACSPAKLPVHARHRHAVEGADRRHPAAAATVARRKVFEAFWSDDPMHALMHGPTFMGNALGCAAANASLDLFEREPRLAQVEAIAGAMAQGLSPCREMPRVQRRAGEGAVGVVELDRIDDLVGAARAFRGRGRVRAAVRTRSCT